MLVLVAVRKVWLTQPLVALSLVMLILGGNPASVAGQADAGDSSNTISVLVKPDAQEAMAPAANQVASIQTGSGSVSNATSFTTRSFESPPAFPNEPQPPKELLMPQSPDRDSFTEPFVSSEEFANELRGGDQNSVENDSDNNVVTTASFGSPVQDRSEAVGTLATTNQNRQTSSSFQSRGSGSQSQSSQFSRPTGPPVPDNQAEPRKTFAPPIVSSFGDSTTPRRAQAVGNAPAVESQSFSSNAGSSNVALSDSPSRNSASSNSKSAAPSTPAASNWRRPVPGQSNQNPAANQSGYPSNRVASQQPSFNAPTAGGPRFNSNANSSYNRGINPNIASSTPQVAPLHHFNSNQNVTSQPGRQTQQSFNRDSSVRPTGFAQPAAPRKVQTELAKRLIARYSVDAVNPQQLSGQPVKLIEMLNQPISTEQRRPMIHQFWDTYFDWASLVNSQQYLKLLDNIPSSSSASDAAMLEMAKMEAQNEVLASEIELVKSQSKLTQFMPNRPASLPPPLPNDLPLIQKYNTQYERYRQHQMMPTNLLGIDKMLPKTLELIASRAETVQMAQSTNQKVVSGVRNRQSSVSDALSAAKSWRSAEQNLLVAVMDYNHAICDYSMTVSRGYQSPEQVVGMLIAKPKATNSNAGGVADRFRNARNTLGNSQNVMNRQSNGQGFNSAQNNQATRAPGGFGGPTNGSSSSGGLSQSTNGGQQGRFQSQQSQQPVRTVEAGAASQFRSTSNRSSFGNPNFGNRNSGNPNSGNQNFGNSNAANVATKSSQEFSLDSGNGFQPPPQKSFGGQSQFNPVRAASAQGSSRTQSPPNEPFAPPQGGAGRSADSQFKQPFGM